MSAVLSWLAEAGQARQPEELWLAWNLSPTLLASLLLMAALYWRGARVRRRLGGQAAWRTMAFAAAWAALATALVSPLDWLAGELLSAHMVQHMLLVLVAAPLLALSAPLGVLLLGLPAEARGRLGRGWQRARALQRLWGWLTRPAVAWGLHTAALWLWHVPALYQAALGAEAVHSMEHAAFLGTAWLFWWVALHPDPRSRWLRGPGGALYLFTFAVQSGLLGALMTFARSPWYPAYAASAPAWGLTPLDDQQLAGAIMWIPAGIVYVVGAVGVLAAWFGDLERRDAARRANNVQSIGGDKAG